MDTMCFLPNNLLKFYKRVLKYQSQTILSATAGLPKFWHREYALESAKGKILDTTKLRCINLYTQTFQVHQFIYPDIPGASIYIPRHPRCINLYTQTSQVHEFIYPDTQKLKFLVDLHLELGQIHHHFLRLIGSNIT